MAEQSSGERLTALEIQVKDIDKQESKIDKLIDIVNGIKDSLNVMSNEFMHKDDCKLRCLECDKKFHTTTQGQKVITGALVVGTVTLILWLVQQLLQVHIKVGGG